MVSSPNNLGPYWAEGFKRTIKSESFDDFIRLNKNVLWNRNADLLGGFEIRDNLEFCCQLNGQVGRLVPL